MADAPGRAVSAWSGGSVSLVIPVRNGAGTIRGCLNAVLPLMHDDASPLAEIIAVNDGSTDETPAIIDRFADVRRVDDTGRGPGAARNAGARVASGELLWFMDADCVAAPDALDLLVEEMRAPEVAGVGGTFGVLNPEHWLARLVHEEIAARHARMPDEVDYLATGHVLYRRSVFETLGGFDERYRTAEDADFAYRVKSAGHRLRFRRDSVVRHFHYERLLTYLRGQRLHGRNRVRLHLAHAHTSGGDAYAGLVDYVQPPLALLTLGGLVTTAAATALGTTALAAAGAATGLAALLLLTAQIPMTARLMRRTGGLRMIGFAPFSFLRSFWRGVGMLEGVLMVVAGRQRGAAPPAGAGAGSP